MTDTLTDSVEQASPGPSAPRRRNSPRQSGPEPRNGPPAGPRTGAANPVLEQLAKLYPHLFGATLLPMKRGIFQDLLASSPETLEHESLKAALAQHTRTTRYLNAVASGQPRHDLEGKAVEALAPEHVHHALLEVFRRRHQRTGEDVRPQLRNRMVQAFEASGLSPEAYSALVHCRDEAANALLEEALAHAQANAAREEALLRAFESSSQTVENFADMYGMNPLTTAPMLERARHRRGPKTT